MLFLMPDAHVAGPNAGLHAAGDCAPAPPVHHWAWWDQHQTDHAGDGRGCALP